MGGGRPSCSPTLMGVTRAAGIYETKTTIYRTTRHKSMLAFWFQFLSIMRTRIRTRHLLVLPLTENREEDQQEDSCSSAAQNKRNKLQLEV